MTLEVNEISRDIVEIMWGVMLVNLKFNLTWPNLAKTDVQRVKANIIRSLSSKLSELKVPELELDDS